MEIPYMKMMGILMDHQNSIRVEQIGHSAALAISRATGIPKTPLLGQMCLTLTVENSELYTTARLSSLSLTYSVKLHFAEIRFTDDKTYSSLRRRVFDVYVQVTITFLLCAPAKQHSFHVIVQGF